MGFMFRLCNDIILLARLFVLSGTFLRAIWGQGAEETKFIPKLVFVSVSVPVVVAKKVETALYDCSMMLQYHI